MFQLFAHWRPIAAAAGLGLALAAGWLAVDRIRETGRREVLTEIDTANREAEDAARKARGPVRACYDDGGVWDTSTGQCRPRRVPGVR